jgi:osmotically-inducible protein OsmY
MKKSLTVLIIFFMAGLFAVRNTSNQESLTTVKAHDPNIKLTDSELEAAIQAHFNRDASFSRVKLIVDSENNLVVLLGTVESEQQRTRAVEIARNGNADLLITDIMKVESR